ncbi:MAG: hypothetical protein O3A00_07395, partial [Planctomycetota bacterium]|nr:hypothetical protein [Planctomycetota bacterium]
ADVSIVELLDRWRAENPTSAELRKNVASLNARSPISSVANEAVSQESTLKNFDANSDFQHDPHCPGTAEG